MATLQALNINCQGIIFNRQNITLLIFATALNVFGEPPGILRYIKTKRLTSQFYPECCAFANLTALDPNLALMILLYYSLGKTQP